MQVIELHASELLEFFDGANSNHVAVVAEPHRNRRTPETVTREVPVAGAFEPLAEASVLDVVRHPVHGLVVFDHPFLQSLGHAVLACNRRVNLQEPSLEGAVNQRNAGTPAVRVAMHNRVLLEHAALFLEEADNFLVGFLCAQALPHRDLVGELAFGIERVEKAEVEFSTLLEVFFTEGRSGMHGASTVFGTHVVGGVNLVVAGQLVRRHECIGNAGKRFVVLAHEFGTLASIHDVRVLEVSGGTACGNPVLLAILFHQVVVHVRAHNDAEVGVQCPRGRRPHEDARVLELGFVRVEREDERQGRVLTVLIALVRFEVRKRSRESRAVRLDAVALVDEALVEALLEHPPHRFHEVLVHGLVALVEVDPAAHAAHGLLPFARVLEHLAAAGFVELVDAELLDFGNASETEFVLHERFNRKAVAVPTETTRNLLALHGPVTRNDVLDGTGKQVTVVRKARCKRRAIVESVRFSFRTGVQRLLERFILIPQAEHALFNIWERLVFVYLTKQSHYSNLYKFNARNLEKAEHSVKTMIRNHLKFLTKNVLILEVNAPALRFAGQLRKPTFNHLALIFQAQMKKSAKNATERPIAKAVKIDRLLTPSLQNKFTNFAKNSHTVRKLYII